MTGVLVWGELLWDRFPDGDRLGGAPANVAWHLAQLGTPVALVTRVGDDEWGRRAIEEMARIGVDTSLVQIDRERATGEVSVTVENGEPRYRLHAGRAWERIELTPAVAARLAGARALVYGTLSQRTPDGLASLGAALAAASPRVLRVCDPNLRPSSPAAGDDAALAQALTAADIVKIGEREVGLVRTRLGPLMSAGREEWGSERSERGVPATKWRERAARVGANQPDDPVAWLLDRGARLVAVTRGADGSTWYAPPSVNVPPLEVAAVSARAGGDNVGCGDAFVAGLVHGLLLGWPWPRIGRLAAAIAAEVASVRGATPVLAVSP